MAKRSSLRASDADRDRVADRLREAAIEGRLLAHELEERLATTLRARTYGELDAVVDDLPGGPSVGPSVAVVQKRPSTLSVAMRHPVPAALLLVVATVAVAGVIAAAVTIFMAGIWLIPLFLFVGLQGPNHRGMSSRGRMARARQRRSRQFQRGGHMHRYGRF